MLEFYVVGVSLGTAWAHPSTGDTVASVMIGGLRTVQNGAFPIHTNDLICIYFDDERDFFEVCFRFLFPSCTVFMCVELTTHSLLCVCTGQRRAQAEGIASERCRRDGHPQGGGVGQERAPGQCCAEQQPHGAGEASQGWFVSIRRACIVGVAC